MRRSDQPYEFNPGVVKTDLPRKEATKLSHDAIESSDKMTDCPCVLRGRIFETWTKEKPDVVMCNPIDKQQDRLEIIEESGVLKLKVGKGVHVLIPSGVIYAGDTKEHKIEVVGPRTVTEHKDPRASIDLNSFLVM